MSWSLDGHPLHSILVARLRYLGDIAMSTVLLSALREGDPELRLGFLCENDHADVLAGHPLLDELHVLSVKHSGTGSGIRKTSGSSEKGAGTWAMIRQLRRARYDLAVDLFFNPRSAWLLRASGSLFRIAGNCNWRQRLYTHIAATPGPEHAEFRSLAPGGFGDHLGRLTPLRHEESGLGFLAWFKKTYTEAGPASLINRPSLGEHARNALEIAGIEHGTRFILLAPGATWPAKEWPLEHWQRLIRRLREMTDRPVAILAPPGKAELYRPLAGACGPHGGLLPVLPLAEALQVVAAGSLLISADGGIMHAAIAMGIPTVALFGPTSPDIWFPYSRQGPFRVLSTCAPCAPCDRHECDEFICLPDLQPEAVVTEVAEMLTAGEGPL